MDLAGIFFRRRHEQLDVEPVRVSQRKRRRHENDLGEVFLRHVANGGLHGSFNIGFVEMRVYIDVGAERGDRFVRCG